jgi:beta-mannosidase
LTVTTEATPTGLRMTVTAMSLVKDIVIQADRLDAAASVDRGLVTLVAGASAVFTITGEIGPDVPSGFPVVSSANDLVTGERNQRPHGGSPGRD